MKRAVLQSSRLARWVQRSFALFGWAGVLWKFAMAATAAPENLATAGIATGSSNYTGIPASQFSDGNDGKRDGHYYNGLSVFHTAIPETSPPSFWEVDLGGSYHLDRVMIWPRTDVAQNTVENFKIVVRDESNAVVWQQSFLPTAAVNTPWATSAMRGVQGRRVRFERLDGLPNFVAFAEFEVWGSAAGVVPNLAAGKPATASPPGFSTSVGNGNDGNLDGNYTLPGNPLYHSAISAPGQYWEVDLGQDKELDFLTIFNRTDFTTTTAVKLTARNAAGNVVYTTTLPDISRNVFIRGGAQMDVTHEFPGVITARYVRIETVASEYLAFTELEVFGPLADTFFPSVTSTVPAAGALVAELFQSEIAFSEAVTGVNASDLLVNGAPAVAATQLAPDRYAFSFAQPANGVVQFSWAAGHGIADLWGNMFAGGSWTLTLNTALPIPKPVISEFLADNEGGLRDEDGNSSDWIEIYNPGPTAVNMNGWYLTDTAALLTKWRFPAAILQPGSRLIVFASEASRSIAGAELHTNFKLKKESGYLALVKPDQTTIASQWSYGAQRTNVSFGTGSFLSGPPLLPRNATAKWLVPSSSIPGWEAPSFNDGGWLNGTGGFGFDQESAGGGLLGFWNFDDASNPAVALDASGKNHTGAINGVTYTADTGGRGGGAGDRALSFTGSGRMTVAAAAAGAFDSTISTNAISISVWVNGDAASQPSQDFLFHGGANADGSGTRVLGAHIPWNDWVIYWDTAGCCDPGLHRIAVGEPNAARWEGQWNHYVFVKNGDTKEIWQNGTLLHSGRNTAGMIPLRSLFLGTAPATNGYHGLVDDFAIWDGALSPVEITTIAGGGSPVDVRKLTPFFGTDISAPMRNVNGSAYTRFHFNVTDPADIDVLLLRIRYDDGFVAYLNGVEIARRNVPANLAFNSTAPVARPGGAALNAEEMDVSSFAALLRAGNNVLALQGLNSTAGDGEFLIQPELVGGASINGRFFSLPTPGSGNGSGFSGFTADTSFSVNRGFYDSPQTVTVTCATPGATIAYTVDGSEPSPTNGTKGTSPVTIPVNTTTVLRAIAFFPGLAPTNVDTHTYLFVDHVATQTRPPSVGATWPTGEPADFAMDGRVYAGAQPGYSVRDALLSIPTLSVTVAPEDLWSASRGIYALSSGRGTAYERVASAEYLVPGQPFGGFHTRFGLRIHGNVSRDKSFTPKHSFKMFFRGDYGDARLKYDLFGSGVDQFDQLILRAGSTDTWACTQWPQVGIGPGGSLAYRWLRAWSSFVRDEWVRATFLAMQQPSPRGRFVHLYLNGAYWGLYNVTEHPDEDFCADTLGGNANDWDTLKDFAEFESGNMTAWNQLIGLAGAGLSTNSQYQRLLGRNADGTPNPAYDVLLNEDSLIDYMLLHIFIGADDWPNHNWWAGRKTRGTAPGDGFHFFPWDQEISNENHTYERSAWGYIYQEANAPNTPTQIYAAARSNLEFRRRFADRIQRHMFNGGPLSQTANVARWNALTGQIDKAVVAESARWGDYQRPPQPYTREGDWLPHLSYMSGTYWPNINAWALSRLNAAGLWPATRAPVFSPFGGTVPITHELSMTNPNGAGTIYYTLNGVDPRAFGGNVAPGALTYGGSIAVNVPLTLKARARSAGGEWSPLAEATFSILPDSDHDGLGDAWELAHGFSLGANEALMDSDGDGQFNLLEYRSGTDPRSAASFLEFDSITNVDGALTFKFLARANRAYTLQRSFNLLSWSNIATHAAETADHTATFTDVVISQRQFYRIQPTVP